MASSNPSIVWHKETNKDPLCEALINTQMDEKQFVKCLEPLQYILFPIGIINLFPDSKTNILLQIWSYVYGISLFFIVLYIQNPNTDAWLASIDEVNNTALSIGLRFVFADYQFTSIGTFIFLRCYFFPKQKLQKLLRELFKYIDETAITMNKDKTQYLQIYYISIYKSIKTLCIFCYIIQFMFALIYTIMATIVFHTNNKISFFKPFMFVWQIYWVWFVIVVIFLVVIKILTIYFYVYTSKIYYYFISRSKNKCDELSIIELNDLQKVFNDDDNYKHIALIAHNDIMNICDLKKEYIKMMRLFNKNATYWNIPFMLATLSTVSQIFGGFIFFFSAKDWDFFLSASLVWSWAVINTSMYLIQISKINTTSDDLREIIAVIDGDIVNDNNNKILLFKLDFNQFIDIHRCSFKVLGIEINWNVTYALLISLSSPMFTYLLSRFASAASS